jgi:hypothetical protein
MAPRTVERGAGECSRQLGGGKNAGTGSGQDGFRIGTIAGTHFALTSSRPGHARVSLRSPVTEEARMKGGEPPIAPLSSELRHCTAYPEHRPEATWAQPLGPGRAVLTRGVSRRSGSVACIRADASPTEVLANPWLHCAPRLVKLLIEFLTHRRMACRGSHPLATRRRRSGDPRGLPSTTWPQLCRTLGSRPYSTGCTPNRKTRCRYCASDVGSSIVR